MYLVHRFRKLADSHVMSDGPELENRNKHTHNVTRNTNPLQKLWQQTADKTTQNNPNKVEKCGGTMNSAVLCLKKKRKHKVDSPTHKTSFGSSHCESACEKQLRHPARNHQRQEIVREMTYCNWFIDTCADVVNKYCNSVARSCKKWRSNGAR